MKKSKLNTSRRCCRQAGFSVLEVILAAAIFMLFSTAGVGAILQGFSTNRLGAEETTATNFATEGIEAVKSIKNQDYTNLTNSTLGKGVQRNAGGVWEFKADNTSDTLTHNITDNYIRKIKVEDVQRDGISPCGNIVQSGGIPDPDTKKITATVDWNFNTSRSNSVELSTYLSDWRKAVSANGPTMMAYSKTTSIPYIRTWNGSAWSTESEGEPVGGNINYIVLKSARTRNEAILGTMDSSGNIYVQVWNGCAWTTPTLVGITSSSDSAYRSFDIAYEKNSDRAIIVFLPNVSSTDPAYRIWDGASWTSPTTITAPPTTGVVRWISTTQNPLAGSNEIAMIMLTSTSQVYGMVWDGSNWSDMGVATTWDTASISTEKTIDVAYEQLSGRAMFIWGDTVATDQYYRIWNGSVLTSASLLDIPASGGVTNWIQLASRPNSNELMYGVLDAGSDLNTRKWSGSGWDTATQHPEHDSSAETNSSMDFDLAWETHPSNPGKAWILWGDGSAVSKKQWSGTAWGSASTLTGSDDTSFIKLKADPSSGTVFAGIYEAPQSSTDDIWESRLTGGGTTWSAENTIWAGPISSQVFFRIDIATP